MHPRHGVFDLLLLWVHFVLNAGAAHHDDAKVKEIHLGHGARRQYYKFITRPDIDAPVWDITLWADGRTSPAPGHLFVAFYDDLHQREPGSLWLGPHIYDQRGNLIWSGAAAFKHWDVFDFGSDHQGSGDMLTLISAHDKKGYILDNTYQIRHEVPLSIDGKAEVNMHVFHIIDGGKKLLLLHNKPSLVSKEEAHQLGFNKSCLVKFQTFQELDLESPNLTPLFEWDVQGHISLEESDYMDTDKNLTRMCRDGYDVFHVNSVDKFPDGDYLVSVRHTNTVYKISHTDGSIVWRLGGTKSDFLVEGADAFSRQHHARVRSQNETHVVMSLFDNAVGTGWEEAPTSKRSRALVLELDTEAMTARAIEEYGHPEHHLVKARGSFQSLPNGNPFICWADDSLMTEYAPYGRMIWRAKLLTNLGTYRAFKYPWIGRPTQPPDVVSQALFNGEQILTQVYMSWNGATEIESWQVYEIDEKNELRSIGMQNRHEFETSFTYNGFARTVVAEAFDAKHQSLGKSAMIHTIPPTKTGVESGVWHNAELDEFASDKESAPDVNNPHPEYSPQVAAARSSLWSLSNALIFGGIAAVVGFTFGLLTPRLAKRWNWGLGKWEKIKYEKVEMEEEWNDDTREADKVMQLRVEEQR